MIRFDSGAGTAAQTRDMEIANMLKKIALLAALALAGCGGTENDTTVYAPPDQQPATVDPYSAWTTLHPGQWPGPVPPLDANATMTECMDYCWPLAGPVTHRVQVCPFACNLYEKVLNGAGY